MKSGVFWFVLIFGCVAVFCFGCAVKILVCFSRLKKTGVVTDGKIIDILQDSEGEQIVVSYANIVGTRFTIISSIASSGYANQVGREVKVLYDPADPERARIIDDVYDQTAMFLVIGIIFRVIALTIALG